MIIGANHATSLEVFLTPTIGYQINLDADSEFLTLMSIFDAGGANLKTNPSTQPRDASGVNQAPRPR